MLENNSVLKEVIKQMNGSTMSVKRVGKNKYRVKDVVEFDGDYGIMSGEQILKEFG